MKIAVFLAFASIVTLLNAQITDNIIWNIPNTTPKAGSSASIAATFIQSDPASLFSILIVSSSGEVVDVVAANETGTAAAVWHIPVLFPAGTYQVRVEVNVNSVITPYLAPTSITVSRGVDSAMSSCPVPAFQPRNLNNFSPIQVVTPYSGYLVGLPPAGSTKPGEFNVEYFWKMNDDLLNGSKGATSLFIDVLAIRDASIPAESQTPTATFAQTSVVPPTVSTKVAPMVIPTVSAVRSFLGAAVVRINYTIGGSADFRSVYSENFFIGQDCSGESIGEGNSTVISGPSTGTSPGVVIEADTSAFTGILIGAIAGSIVFTLIVVFLVLWLLKRRKAARRRKHSAGEYQ